MNTQGGEAVLDKRIVNALFSNARAIDALSVAGPALSLFQNAYGGLWVGGTASLSAESLSFLPNALNRAVHENSDELQLSIPLKEVTAVAVRFGLFTKIIDVDSASGRFSMRCYGAKSFAVKIDRTRRAIIGG